MRHLIPLLLVCLFCMAIACGGKKNAAVQQHRLPDTLTVGTLYSPTGFFILKGDTMGYDYDRICDFARSRGIALQFVVARSMPALIDMLQKGSVDVLGCEIPVTAEYKSRVLHCGAVNETYYSGFYYRGHTNDGSWYTTGFGIRKFLNPDKAVSESQNPWYDIRYTEILLNYCEAQVEVGGTNAGKSKEYLNAIRRRAFFQDQRDATLSNVLHERRVELCFEEDYARTLYRRRAFFNRERDLSSNPNGGRKHALIPILDLRSGSPKYVFVRANHYDWDTDLRQSIASWNPLAYYSGVPNWNTTNKITPNPSQE